MTTSSASIQFHPGHSGRALHKWLLALVMVTVIALGWKYPLLGFAVPAAMATGIVGGLFRGRFVCGNICPRGSFFDTYFNLVGSSKPVPPFLQSMGFRWSALAAMMGFMTWRILQDPGSLSHWGSVFWSICAITTGLGVVLGLAYRPRTWCSFCPVGTMQNALGGHKDPLRIDAGCKSCRICEKNCPMGLSIAEHKEAGQIPHRDCLKCSSCETTCPAGALSWDKAA
ncbi:MAG: FeS-binding protein [Desulfuromonas sp.]|uniref:4Fe-4S binding protein n=1 Tax=Desulfuromonas sp. TaxID=892 RepID=UPI000CB72805|nr:4Fe-4S binding protein [Desulfuromonas sp.]PLX85910.1 MAG: FeS-binding protein [Desulfuromonas sp.]